MTFNVPEIENPAIVTSGAAGIRAAGEAVESRMQDTAGAWQPIRGQYEAPEAAQVHQAMDTPEQMAADTKASAGQIADRLEAYATMLGKLRAEKEALEAEIRAYEAAKAVANLAAPSVSQSLEAWETLLHARCNRLRMDRDNADKACARSISGIVESAGEALGKKLLRGVTRSNDVLGEWGPTHQAARLAPDLVKYYTMYYFFMNGSIKIREGWAPSLLQNLAGKGKFGEGLVKSLTGWDASAVTNKERFLSMSSPMNPMAKPTTVGGTLQAIAGRSLLKLEGKTSRVPHRHSQGVTQAKWDRLAKASKIASKAGTGVSGVTSTVVSWQTDSHEQPNMGNWEKGTRAGFAGLGAAGGGLAGGKAGAATGAAIGSFFGPVGTVVGGVAGGIIGGVAGGSAGGWLAKQGNEHLVSPGFRWYAQKN